MSTVLVDVGDQLYPDWTPGRKQGQLQMAVGASAAALCRPPGITAVA